MNRNVESHFALNPTSLDIKRSMFDRSSGVKFSANIGELIPFYIDEVLPGDTFKVKSSKVVRLQTMLHPIMDNMYMDTYFFFVPNRLVWDHWKNFCGESEKAWTPDVEYTVPRLGIISHPGTGSLADYMGIPLNIELYTPAEGYPQGGVNALPFRAYAKVCDDWFRAEALTDPLVIYTDDTTRQMNAADASDLYCSLGGPVFHVSKYHDYFTSCLPAPQSGPAVNIPTSKAGLAPVGALGPSSDYRHNFSNTSLHAKISNLNSLDTGFYGLYMQNYSNKPDGYVRVDTANSISSEGMNEFVPDNLWANLSIGLGTINDLRIAFQVQKFYEKMSRGRRYIEVLKAQFGVTSPDARLQRSEYLGGNRIPLNIHEVTNNSKGESSFLGDLGAMSRTIDVHDDFVHSFTEHGFVIGVCCVRYDHSYPQGLERFWSRSSIFDYYWPVFANIGEQAVKVKEINFVANGTNTYDRVFGYQEAWADYRYKPSRVAGEMRPEAANSLASWHLADYYEQSGAGVLGPYLSDSWIREDKTNVDRALAVTSAVSNQYFADIYIQNIATRAMPVYSIPGLADHH